jgi:8-oxo-dGTP pyrophosphatase MutT (NUDIX family)
MVVAVYNRAVIEAAILTAIVERLVPALTARQRPPHALRVDGHALACFDAARLRRLAAFDRVFVREGDQLAFAPGLRTPQARTEALESVTRTLAREGALTAWRDERYAAAPAFTAAPAFLVERAAARYLGIHTFAAHANGLVLNDRGAARVWLARRSAGKAIDPSMLDNLVGGGIAHGEAPGVTLVREAWEEAGIPPETARTARRVGELYVERAVPDGFQRETIFAYDLALAPSFVPANQDGEAVEHRLVDFSEAARLASLHDGPDVVTIDASLVTLDCLLRHGAIPRDAAQRLALEALCRPVAGASSIAAGV